jgi:hypothetical protein
VDREVVGFSSVAVLDKSSVSKRAISGCEQRQLDPAGAQLIHHYSNAVYLLPAEPRSMGNVHTPEYFTHVNNLMSGTRNADEALDVLSYIRTSLLGGFWP